MYYRKESSLGAHASGRNSKAKFTRKGNQELKKFCEKKA